MMSQDIKYQSKQKIANLISNRIEKKKISRDKGGIFSDKKFHQFRRYNNHK